MTNEIDKKTPVDRLILKGDLKPVMINATQAFGVGNLTDFSIIDVGYEER